MADRVLPSREQAQQLLDQRPRLAIGAWFWALVEAYASGRLVDREAIDYGAAKKLVDIWLETVDMHDDDAEQIYALVMDAVDAALPDLEV